MDNLAGGEAVLLIGLRREGGIDGCRVIHSGRSIRVKDPNHGRPREILIPARRRY